MDLKAAAAVATAGGLFWMMSMGQPKNLRKLLRLNGDLESISKLDDSGTTGEEVTEGSNANVLEAMA
ncbi:hypothetical protein Q3G72_013631 [Acer saccharum]|nr:hypothetical protein Q3G72_009723 [Acer saccharum]KAK1576416.1 hypothetical protein Q3G72_013631 [Acer saccharum]